MAPKHYRNDIQSRGSEIGERLDLEIPRHLTDGFVQEELSPTISDQARNWLQARQQANIGKLALENGESALTY